MLLFKLAQKVTEFWGYACSKICRLELVKLTNLVTLLSAHLRRKDIRKNLRS